MGLREDRAWEIQWHPARGGTVRRLVLTPRRMRNVVVSVVLLVVVVLGLLGILPIGLRTLLARFTLDAVKRENATLRSQQGSFQDRAVMLALGTRLRLQRALRLAWVLGAPETVWAGGVPVPPSAQEGADALVAWFGAQGPRLDDLASRLERLGASSGRPVSGLPTGSVVDMGHAVPVAPFGWRVSPFTGKREAHHGVTLAAPLGEPVLAPGAGRVLFAGTMRERRSNEWTRLGTLVVLDHGGGVVTVFGHLDKASVRRGQRVARGDLIGTVGRSGWTRVPALYYEVRWPVGGTVRPVDPAIFDLALPMEDAATRLADPAASLPEDYAVLSRLPGVR